MRSIISLNQDWLFIKDTADITVREGEHISLPHTWNATDGQDGGNDYFRGSCLYVKTLRRAELPVADLYFLEFRGVNASADVYLNGAHLAHHDGGYSTWRVNITEALGDEGELAVLVDNAPSDTVYPQMADFTFYGGLYRGVNLICVNASHFDLEYYGGPGLAITPTVEGKNATVTVDAYVTGMKEGQALVYTLYDKDERELFRQESTETRAVFTIEDVHLWHGRRDPYLYCCKIELTENGEVLDSVCSRFGCRSFRIDPDNGFILNGEEYPCAAYPDIRTDGGSATPFCRSITPRISI